MIRSFIKKANHIGIQGLVTTQMKDRRRLIRHQWLQSPISPVQVLCQTKLSQFLMCPKPPMARESNRFGVKAFKTKKKQASKITYMTTQQHQMYFQT